MSRQISPGNERTYYQCHRLHLRDRLMAGGARAFEEYELLELLLTFAIPYYDVKLLAQKLVAHFGSFGEVLDASPQELAEFKSLRESSICLVYLVKTCLEAYLRERTLKRRSITSLDLLIDYCRTSMGGLKEEQFRVIYLNSENEILAEEVLHEGTVNQTAVYPRKILELALKYKATGLILVHNHPSGNPRPSVSDRELTLTVTKVSQALNLTLHDHLIIGRHGYFSFAKNDML
jgi:DNA repair protein RadC